MPADPFTKPKHITAKIVVITMSTASKVTQIFCTYSGLSLYACGMSQLPCFVLYSTSCDSRRSKVSCQGSQIKPISLRMSILLRVIWDRFPSINFLYCVLCVLTQNQAYRKYGKDSRYQRVKNKRANADIPHLL